MSKSTHIGAVLLIFVAGTELARGTQISLSLQSATSQATYGQPADLEVWVSADLPAAAVQFAIGTAGALPAQLTARSLAPTGANGMSYVSMTSQDPFEDNLPHDLSVSPSIEIIVDLDFEGNPGGPTDGLVTGAGVLLETITLVPTGLGTLTVTLSGASGAYTQGQPEGRLFETVMVNPGSVVLEVEPPGGPCICGDLSGEGVVDLVDFVTFISCLGLPGPGGSCTTRDWLCSDLDGTLIIDLNDVLILTQLFGQAPTGSPPDCGQ